MNNRKYAGFTLIELLIVVAIIAILAAIAVPNFLEAQVRAKVSRVKSDMRTLTTAIESYTVDNNRQPIGFFEGATGGACGLNLWPGSGGEFYVAPYRQLITPIAYMSSIPPDPFRDKRGRFNPNNPGTGNTFNIYYEYQSNMAIKPCNIPPTNNNFGALKNGYRWFMFSQGPYHLGRGPFVLPMLAYPNTGGSVPTNIYDPTNGTVSEGFIIRTNKGMYYGENAQ